jgi:hypothetical protein
MDRRLNSLRRKWYCVFLSPLKMDRRRPGLNPRTLGIMANTITTRPRRATITNINTRLYFYRIANWVSWPLDEHALGHLYVTQIALGTPLCVSVLSCFERGRVRREGGTVTYDFQLLRGKLKAAKECRQKTDGERNKHRKEQRMKKLLTLLDTWIYVHNSLSLFVFNS